MGCLDLVESPFSGGHKSWCSTKMSLIPHRFAPTMYIQCYWNVYVTIDSGLAGKITHKFDT